MTDAQNMVTLSVKALEEKKGWDITVLDISKVSVLADYFIIVSGDNDRQVSALTDAVDEALTRGGYEKKNIEGYHTGNWILLDYNDVIIHVFNRESRAFYDLERLFSDAKRVELPF